MKRFKLATEDATVVAPVEKVEDTVVAATPDTTVVAAPADAVVEPVVPTTPVADAVPAETTPVAVTPVVAAGDAPVEGTEPAVPTAEVEEAHATITQLETFDTVLEETSTDIKEAEQIQETVGELGEAVATDIEATGEIAPETAKVVEIATEHFAKRLSITTKVLPSLENFKDSQNKAQDSKKAVVSLVALETAIESQLALTQEGFFEDLKTSISMIGTTEESLTARADAVAKADFSKTKEFTNIGWSKYISSSSEVMTGDNVIKALQSALKTNKSSEVASLTKDLVASVSKLTREVRANWFYSNKRDIEIIQEIGASAAATVEALKKESDSVSGKRSMRFVSPDKKESTKILSLVKELIDENSLEQVVKTLDGKSLGLKMWSFVQHFFRLKSLVVAPVAGSIAGNAVAGATGTVVASKLLANAQLANLTSDEVSWLDKLQPEDLTEAKKAAVLTRRALADLRLISSQRLKMASAVISYLENSAS